MEDVRKLAKFAESEPQAAVSLYNTGLKEGTHGCGKKLNYIKTPKHII